MTMAGEHLSPDRSYRRTVGRGRGEVSFQAAVEETDLYIVAQADLSREVSDFLHAVRGEIKSRILIDPAFGKSLLPVEVADSAPEIVRIMARAGKACGVGPMAAVAGAIAQAVGDRFAPRSPNILVENGGDLYLRSTRERTVALLSDPESGSSLGISLGAAEFPTALCSSSGRIGHSLSLGQGDLVTVRARDAAFADAAATALANLLQEPSDLDRVLAEARKLSAFGLEGVFAQFNDKLAVWGDLELVALD